MNHYQNWIIIVLCFIGLVGLLSVDRTSAKFYQDVLRHYQNVAEETESIENIVQSKVETLFAMSEKVRAIREQAEYLGAISDVVDSLNIYIDSITKSTKFNRYGAVWKGENLPFDYHTDLSDWYLNTHHQRLLTILDRLETAILNPLNSMVIDTSLIEMNVWNKTRMKIDSVSSVFKGRQVVSFKNGRLTNDLSGMNLLLDLKMIDQEVAIFQHKIVNAIYHFSRQVVANQKGEASYQIKLSSHKSLADTWEVNLDKVSGFMKYMTIEVNGDSIPMKNGIGQFEFKPTQRGVYKRNIAIGNQNPFTKKSNTYKKTFKIRVY